jgi:hypothetical protein
LVACPRHGGGVLHSSFAGDLLRRRCSAGSPNAVYMMISTDAALPRCSGKLQFAHYSRAESLSGRSWGSEVLES